MWLACQNANFLKYFLGMFCVITLVSKGYREVWVLKKIVSLSPTTWAGDLGLKLKKYPRKSLKYFENPKILKIWLFKLKMHFSSFFVEKLAIFNSDSFFWQKINIIWHLTCKICSKNDDFSQILQFWAQFFRFRLKKSKCRFLWYFPSYLFSFNGF